MRLFALLIFFIFGGVFGLCPASIIDFSPFMKIVITRELHPISPCYRCEAAPKKLIGFLFGIGFHYCLPALKLPSLHVHVCGIDLRVRVTTRQLSSPSFGFAAKIWKNLAAQRQKNLGFDNEN